MSSLISQPHDHFVKFTLQDSKIAKHFFQQYLPAHIQRIVDLDSLRLQQETFVNDELKAQEVDLLYTANFGHRPGYLYLLTEHQSTADYWMPFRLLKYMVAIMDHHVKTKDCKELPIVYPIVLYSNKKHYDQPTDLLSLFGEHKELAKEILWQPFHLIDLTLYPDDKLKIIQDVFLQVFLRTLKNVQNQDLIVFLKEIHPPLIQIEQTGRSDYVEVVVRYLLKVGENKKVNKNPEEFFKVLNKGFSKKTQGIFMTLEEQLIQIGKDKAKEEVLAMAAQLKEDGKMEGEREGEMKALRTVAINLLKEGMPVEKVILVTHLPRSEIEDLR